MAVDWSTDSYVTLPERFEEIVRRYGELEAIRSPWGRLLYREVDQQSRRLAARLGSLLGKEPRPVAMLLEDRAQTVIGLLGIIRSGHFYCALMHRDPPSRLSKVLGDLESPLLITDEGSLTLARQIAPPGCEVLLLSDLPETVEMELPVQPGPDTLLGVFYTSGSTGEPKGVLRTHSYVMHRLWVDLHEYGLGPGDRVLFMLRFDVTVSLSNLFNTLLSGATLILCEADLIGSASLVDLIQQEQVTIFSPPIEFMRNFLDSLDEDVHFESIRAMLLSGDVLFRRDVERLFRHLPSHAKIAHFLSSSECGLLTRTILSPESLITTDIIPVGRPVAGREILILDSDGKTLPIGGSGQIAIRSVVVFPGYWRLPDASASKFVTDPEDPDRKVYCTGDFGYFKPDGELVFLGRNDLRVKIRGFTIDCSSVEGALATLPQVKRAVIVPVSGQNGHKWLVGFVVLERGCVCTTTELRTAVSEHLPEHMVPQRIVLLQAIPQTPNGKIDRAALQTLASQGSEPLGPSEPPTSTLEWTLARIWEELLDVRPIGVKQDFVQLGGHSLLAVRMLDRVEQELGVRLPVSTLLQTTTIKGLAQVIIAGEATRLARPITTMSAHGRKPAFVFLHGDYSGCGFYCRGIAEHFDRDRPFLVIPCHGLEDDPPRTIETMAADRVSQLLADRLDAPFILGGYCNGGLIAYEMACQLERLGRRVPCVLVIEAAANNPQHRLLQSMFRFHGLLHGFTAQERMAFGVTALRVVQAMEEAGSWVPLRSIQGWRDRASAMLKRLYRIHRIKRRLMKESLGPDSKRKAESPATEGSRESFLIDIYAQAVRGYKPPRFGGKVVVLTTSHLERRFPGDPLAGWGQVAAKAMACSIPGDHLTCITEHGATLASTMTRLLDEVEAP